MTEINNYIDFLKKKVYTVESINQCEVNAELYKTLKLMECLQQRKQS